MELIRTYIYSIVPTQVQKTVIESMLKCSDDIYNRYLSDLRDGKYLSVPCYSVLNQYYKETPCLKSFNRSMLINTMFSVKYKRNYDTLKFHEYGNNIDKFIIEFCKTGNLNLVNNGRIKLPSIGEVKIKYHRELPANGTVKQATIRRKNDKYYLEFVSTFESDNVEPKLSVDKSIGIDYSPKHFYIDSNGLSIDMPRYLSQKMDLISKEVRRMFLYEKGSDGYNKHLHKLRSLYDDVENCRLNFLHNLSNTITNNYDYICLETLNLNEHAKKKPLAMNTKENSFGTFQRLLEYKAHEKGKKVIKVDKWFPSSKLCSVCHAKYSGLTLDDRVWQCPVCHTTHDRDINAAINIRNEGLKQIN